MEKHRGWADIVADVLTAAAHGTRKTRLMYATNLNTVRMKKYLNCLLDLGLMTERTNSPAIYLTTERGLEWLKAYEKIKIDLLVGKAS